VVLFHHFLFEVGHSGNERIFNALHVAVGLLLIVLLTWDHLAPHLDHLSGIVAAELEAVLKSEVRNISIYEVIKVIIHFYFY
jgi:hypothetical protein